MLLLERIEIRNFACFGDVDLDLASSSDHRLTVIRAENGSGKTTFLRALRWAFYGERGLPGDDPARFSVHPAWWSPDHGSVETHVAITFATDGGTRHQEGKGSNQTYRFARAVETVARTASRDDEPDFKRLAHTLSLLRKRDGGGWEPYSDDPEVIERTVNLLLPWGLRDFFFLDADEATDFIGGRENKPLPKKEVIEKTTAAVNELLGLETFYHAIDRVEDLQRVLQREASRASGDVDLQEMQEELDSIRERIRSVSADQASRRDEQADLEGHRDQLKAELHESLKKTGAHEELERSLRDNDAARAHAKAERKRVLEELSVALERGTLLSGLVAPKIQQVFSELEPLHEKGLIPLSHVSFVRERLDHEECICGESLAEGTPHRRNVEALLSSSVEQEAHSNLLGSLFDAASSFLRDLRGDTSDWAEVVRNLRSRLGELDAWVSELEGKNEELKKRISEVDVDQVQTLKGELDATEEQLVRLHDDLVRIENRLKPLRANEASLDKTIIQRQKREQAARDQRAAAELAEVIGQALASAYGAIQQEQVRELSQRMNQLFSSMAANVQDEDFGDSEREKASVRMIAEVGVRELEPRSGRFEIYATNHRGRLLPPVEINGASRRVLALSFILALCQESNTEAPLLADSLLNMMSGKVRTNTFRTTAVTSRQPILLLTRADLAGEDELDIVGTHAGATYTLTGQWDVASEGGGGDVVNRTADRLVAVACTCGPWEYCSICERAGDRERAGWSYVERP